MRPKMQLKMRLKHVALLGLILTSTWGVQAADIETYYNQANTFLGKGEFVKAIEAYSQVIKLDPKHADAYFNRAGCL